MTLASRSEFCPRLIPESSLIAGCTLALGSVRLELAARPQCHPQQSSPDEIRFPKYSYGHYKGDHGSFYAVSKGAKKMGEGKSVVLQGTLDLMELKTLYALGPLHGFGIARRTEQVGDGVLHRDE